MLLTYMYCAWCLLVELATGARLFRKRNFAKPPAALTALSHDDVTDFMDDKLGR